MAAAIQDGAIPQLLITASLFSRVNPGLVGILPPSFIMVILVRIETSMPLPSCVAELGPPALRKPHKEWL